ncbi:MAG: hypothetical protein Ct9H300mP8_04590 [Gammaproteobacteria bacterium]|nr:MAG: hypothetical protein Ct9H300mP8_04590 [Gammaproteobacteria bacterium]
MAQRRGPRIRAADVVIQIQPAAFDVAQEILRSVGVSGATEQQLRLMAPPSVKPMSAYWITPSYRRVRES